MRRKKFTAVACDQLRLEAKQLSREQTKGMVIFADELPPPKRLFGSVVFNLPPIESDPHGYERQVLADLQVGLMCLHEGAIEDRMAALMNIRDGGEA